MANKVDIQITANSRQASAEFGKLETQLKSVGSQIRTIGGIGLAFLGFGQLQQGLATLTRTVDEFANLRSRLLLVEKAQTNVNSAFAGLTEIARSTHSSLVGVSDVYTRIAKGGEALGVSQQAALDITRTVAQALKLSGASAVEAQNAITQFGQALQAGALRGQDLNSVLAQAPALAEAIAKGMGREVGDLKRLAEQGRISTETVLNALQQMGPQIEREFRQLTPTIGDAFADLNRELGLYVDRLNTSTGASGLFAGAVTLLAQHLDAVASALEAVVIAGLGAYIGRIGLAVQATLAARSAMLSSTVAAAGLQSQLLLAGRSAAGAASSLGRTSAAMRVLGTVSGGFLRIIGGWPGLIATALLGGVAAWLQWGEAAETASERAVKALQNVRQRAAETGQSEMAVLRAAVDSQQAELAAAENRLASEQARFDRIATAARESNFATPRESPELQQARAAVAQAKGDIKTMQDELARLESNAAERASREASEAWKSAYLTRQEQLKAALAALDEMYASERNRLVDNAAALQQLSADYERKKAELMRQFADRSAKTGNSNRDAARAEAAGRAAEAERKRRLEQIQNELFQAENDMLRMSGQHAEALGNELVARYAATIADLRAQGDEVGAALIERLIGTKVVDARLAELKAKVSTALEDVRARTAAVFDNFGRVEQSAARQVDIGALTPGAARDTVADAREQTLTQYRGLRTELEALAEKSPEAARALAEFDARAAEIASTNVSGLQGALISLRKEFDDMRSTFAGDALTGLRDGLAGFFTSLSDRSKSAKEALKDFARGFAESMAAIAARVVATAAVLALFNAIPGGGALLQLAGLSAKVAHAGGVAEQVGRSRRVPAVIFAGAARYHTGGVAGLAPNEVPAILKRGEEVITASDPRHVANGGASAAPLQSVRINLLDDRSNIGDYMSSSAGEQVIMEVIDRNQARLRTLLG